MRVSSTLVPLALTIVIYAAQALAATADQWRGRTIYQVMTDRFARPDGSTTAICNTGDEKYCGGTFRGLIDHLDYIHEMGFTAIWISPIVKQIESFNHGEPYHGYWAQDIYAVNERFGSKDDLKALSSELHSRGMYLMVDVAPNHNAFDGEPDQVDYSLFNPFNRSTYYHEPCVMDYLNQTSSEVCWLSVVPNVLADVRTEDRIVSQTYQSWIRELVNEYAIDGLRLDSSNHMAALFLSQFVEAAGTYVMGEVFEGDPNFSCGYQNQLDGLTNYNTYFAFISAFGGTGIRGKMDALADMVNQNKAKCKDTSLLAQFTENHDVARFAMINPDMNLAKNALVYSILSDGIPVVWQGQEQHYQALGGTSERPMPFNREAVWLSAYRRDSELYKIVALLNLIRNFNQYADRGFLTWHQVPIYTDGTTIAFRKGSDGMQLVTVLSNLGFSGSDYSFNLSGSSYANGMVLTDVLSCQLSTVDGNGNIPVSMVSGLPKAYLPSTVVSGWGVC